METFEKKVHEYELQTYQLMAAQGIAAKIINIEHHEYDTYFLITERWATSLDVYLSSPDHRLQSFREQTILLLKKIHSLGYFHGDVKARNIVIRGDELRFIDFGDSSNNILGLEDEYASIEEAMEDDLQHLLKMFE